MARSGPRRNNHTVETDTTQLVGRCIDGDEAAWTELVGRYERLVYSIALCEGLSQEQACDVAQTVFVTVLRRLDTLRDIERLDAWLAVVTRRTSWRFRNSGRVELPVGDGPALDLAPDEIAAVATRLDVHRAVGMLEDPCQTLIRSLFLDPTAPDYPTIASRIGRPVGSIGPLRARCLAMLRNLLQRTTEEETS